MPLKLKSYNPTLLLSPNKHRPPSTCGQAIVPASCSADGRALGWLIDSLHSVRSGPMASWIDWPKGAVGGKHFLCVNGRSCRCTVAACGRVMAVIPFPSSLPHPHFAFTLPVNQKRVKIFQADLSSGSYSLHLQQNLFKHNNLNELQILFPSQDFL